MDLHNGRVCLCRTDEPLETDHGSMVSYIRTYTYSELKKEGDAVEGKAIRRHDALVWQLGVEFCASPSCATKHLFSAPHASKPPHQWQRQNI